MSTISRRAMLVGSGVLVGAPVAGLFADQAGERTPKLKVIVAGAHPGDPEAACGGTMARLAEAGHTLVALYATRGERGIKGKSPKDAGATRTEEANKACKLLKAKALFANQIDGDSRISLARYDEFNKLLEGEKPDVVFTHWPIDTHRDHRACSLFVYDAWLALRKKCALYFYEVATGQETQHFRPTHYVDIAKTENSKRAACFAHASQNPTEFYADQEVIHRFRGLEAGCKLAEAFIHHEQSPMIGLLT
ncbi:MAG: PIG-L deacetylase family protein [Gemmataceae bacterium]